MHVFKRPLLLAIVFYLFAIILVAPWGDYPLNDDWNFARVAKTFAETGQIKVDPPVAPALIGQVILSYPAIRMFGFSHTTLRLVTIALALCLLVFIDRHLRIAGVGPMLRGIALLALVTNPLFMYLSTTYFSEIYGYFFAFASSLVWFQSRKRLLDSKSGVLISWQSVLGSAALAACAFWTRQFATIVFPAMVFALIVAVWKRGQWDSLKRSGLRVAVATALYLGMCLAYFPWAKATGNYTTNFSGPLGSILEISHLALRVQPMVMMMYLTFFLAPLLFLNRWLEPNKKVNWIFAAVWAALLSFCLYPLNRIGESDLSAAAWFHQHFPYLGNNLSNASIGAITLSDIYQLGGQLRPRWSSLVWTRVEQVLFVLSFLWFIPMRTLNTARRRFDHLPLRKEMLVFLATFAAGSIAIVWQSYKTNVFDRYYFPVVIITIMLLVIGMSVHDQSKDGMPLSSRRLLATLIGFLPIAFYSIAGVHDQFSWNNARWELFHRHVQRGISPHNIENGYEGDWVNYDYFRAHGRGQLPKSQCINGTCGCGMGWSCIDDSYTIGMNLLAGYHEVDAIQPSYWLAKGPRILFSARNSTK